MAQKIKTRRQLWLAAGLGIVLALGSGSFVSAYNTIAGPPPEWW